MAKGSSNRCYEARFSKNRSAGVLIERKFFFSAANFNFIKNSFSCLNEHVKWNVKHAGTLHKHVQNLDFFLQSGGRERDIQGNDQSESLSMSVSVSVSRFFVKRGSISMPLPSK